MGNCLSSHPKSPTFNHHKETQKRKSELPVTSYFEEPKSIDDSNDSFCRKSLKKKQIQINYKNIVQTTEDAPNAVITNREKSGKDLEIILEALSKHFVFKGLRKDLHQAIVSHMKLYELGPNEIIFEQDQFGNNFFVVESGELEVLIGNHRVNLLHTGDSFGELALLHDSPRSATIKTTTKTNLWGIDRNTFRKALEAINAANYHENKRFVDTISLFNILTFKQKEALVFALSSFKFSDTQKIVNEGDPGDLLYIIKEGTVSCTVKGVEIRRMGRGEYFGDQALLYGSVRTATITAVGNVECIATGRDKLVKCLGSDLNKIIYKNSQKIAIDNSKFLKKLTPEQCLALIANMEVKTYTAKTKVISKGTQKGDHLLMILKGKLKNSENVYEKFSCLGDEEIIDDSLEVHESDIFAEEDSDIALISKVDFQVCIGGRYRSVTANNEALRVMKKTQLLRGLSFDRLMALSQALVLHDFQDGQVIVQQSDPGDSFFIVKTGKVEVYKDDQMIRTVKKLDYFGERSLLFDKARSASVIAKGPATV